MPGIKTEITEIATGIGALGVDLSVALAEPPAEIVNVDPPTWERLRAAHRAGGHRELFTASWLNGRSFLLATRGLRGRIPIRVEWKGPDKPPESDPIPADLRIDHVFLVSVKTRSDVIWNRSPARVFLQSADRANWFADTARDEYQALYEAAVRCAGASRGTAPGGLDPDGRAIPGDDTRAGAGDATLDLAPERSAPVGPPASTALDPGALPASVADLDPVTGKLLGAAVSRGRQWAPALAQPYRDFCRAVAIESARRWNEAIDPRRRREVAWWLLRLAPAPYFLLGATSRGPLRVRVDTPWDWIQRWELVDLRITPAIEAGQPQVDWLIVVRDRSADEVRHVAGYVEIRWSHGRFSGSPEAKVQLRTNLVDVPGYVPLD